MNEMHMPFRIRADIKNKSRHKKNASFTLNFWFFYVSNDDEHIELYEKAIITFVGENKIKKICHRKIQRYKYFIGWVLTYICNKFYLFSCWRWDKGWMSCENSQREWHKMLKWWFKNFIKRKRYFGWVVGYFCVTWKIIQKFCLKFEIFKI